MEHWREIPLVPFLSFQSFWLEICREVFQVPENPQKFFVCFRLFPHSGRGTAVLAVIVFVPVGKQCIWTMFWNRCVSLWGRVIWPLYPVYFLSCLRSNTLAEVPKLLTRADAVGKTSEVSFDPLRWVVYHYLKRSRNVLLEADGIWGAVLKRRPSRTKEER